MNWFKKEDEKKQLIPPVNETLELPLLPDLPSLSERENQVQELPLSPPPNMPLQKKSTSLPPPPISTQEKRTFEINNYNFKQETIEPPQITPREIKSEPIFIKLDKFKDASESFSAIKEKIKDIESSLDKIKEIKERENEEIREWEHELSLIKARMDSIDNSLFSKLGED